MKKTEKILTKETVRFRKHGPTRILIGFFIKTAKESQNLNLKIKTELDFFNASILNESLKNKALFESTYERERKELHDLWPTLSYQEKNKLINLKINETKKRCRSFKDHKGQTIWIAFFDELLNALYDREMNIFDLEQYFSLYKNFKNRMIPTEHYGVRPFADEFIDVQSFQCDDHQCVFYYDPWKAVYSITETQGKLTLCKLGFKKDYTYRPEDESTMIKLMTLYKSKDEKALIDALILSPFVSEKTAKALEKIRKKIK
mgnify:CR=1 FL=1